LLSDAREQAISVDGYIQSVRDFWIAKSRLDAPCSAIRIVHAHGKTHAFTRTLLSQGAGIAVAAGAVAKSRARGAPEIVSTDRRPCSRAQFHQRGRIAPWQP